MKNRRYDDGVKVLKQVERIEELESVHKITLRTKLVEEERNGGKEKEDRMGNRKARTRGMV